MNISFTNALARKITAKYEEKQQEKRKKEQGQHFLVAKMEATFSILFTGFAIFLLVCLIIISFLIPYMVETEEDRMVLLWLYIVSGIMIILCMGTTIYYRSWKLTRFPDRLVIRKLCFHKVIKLSDIEAAMRKGKVARRTSRFYYLPYKNGYYKVNISQTQYTISILDDVLQDLRADEKMSCKN
ncbi:hypothetical protein [Anaerosporobacter faecicola]|uniref:hypothetical protein n=1 Tax=Anaerosporobacter faecicola TaxID=2718714 RepID=UPI00143B1101|nr:hypothetical protein [Anaerosporobacter faecicola]